MVGGIKIWGVYWSDFARWKRGGADEEIFGWWVWGPSPHALPSSREKSAIPETKLGHKIQQKYNRLNYKMYLLKICNHTQEQNISLLSK